VIVTDCLDARLFVAVEPTGRVGRDVGVVFHRSPKLRRRRFPLHLGYTRDGPNTAIEWRGQPRVSHETQRRLGQSSELHRQGKGPRPRPSPVRPKHHRPTLPLDPKLT
jgi:hypothetical protein